MISDLIKAKGKVHFVLTDSEGNIKEQFEDNLVVDTGLAYIAMRMKTADLPTAMSHMAVGTGTTAAAAAQTTLVTEIARVALTSTTAVTSNVTNDATQYIATFAPGTGTGAITEAGIFNGGTTGTMLCRTNFAVINKDVNDTLTITWKITIA
jgi:hypothetical protein